ncbi:YihA family ribosome biogenesis GTP-binding protein [Verrucomicrobiaceae bacterium N1E253]|uniref:Probable GTP-binding protein EngB n=1 Tax=Oceaniferula marina TaxID=2748318 RepID=A0A851GCM9_9BACT|nr:ribosome biogenesis GTP-binding protein YihA/YsxC [Oceaniferula marina]NWK54692.1 YihA family ribosome biogenesis GTP-binding protein [Oceaniferula marina]
MQIHSAQFEISAPDLDSCPESDLPEFAFIGRSNVGKSSLINTLTNKHNLAMVSAKPGKTRLINFFRINQKWDLVDLPGYGYAKASGQTRNKFNVMVSDYLVKRDNLSCVFVLIDCRHEAQKLDLEFTAWLIEYQIPFVLVFTKTDKVKPTIVQKHIDYFKKAMSEFCDGLPRIYTCSAKTGTGRKEILQFIDQAVVNFSRY